MAMESDNNGGNGACIRALIVTVMVVNGNHDGKSNRDSDINGGVAHPAYLLTATVVKVMVMATAALMKTATTTAPEH